MDAFSLLFSSFSFGVGDDVLGFRLLLLPLGNEVTDIVNGAKIKEDCGGGEVHMPIIEGDDAVEKNHQRVNLVFPTNGEHVIDLNQVTLIVTDIVLDKITVESHVAEIDEGIKNQGDAHRCGDVFGL